MKQSLIYREARVNDINKIIALLVQDELGQQREIAGQELDQSYIDAFHKINLDGNQYLMVVELLGEIIATSHLTIMPSLTFKGATRMQIEAVRVDKKLRGQGVGEWMINAALEYGKTRGASIFQLSTNKSRIKAKKFYEKIGFVATHEGMKLYL